MAKAAPVTFVVHGTPLPAGGDGAGSRGTAIAALPAGLARGRRKQAVQLGAARGADAMTRVTAVPGEDVVVLHIAGGPSLVLHPETARDLMLATQGRSREAADAAATDEVTVGAPLRWPGLDKGAATRGLLGDVLLKGIEVLTGVAKDSAADVVAAGVVKRVDAQVDTGVYQLAPQALPHLKGQPRLPEVPAAPADEPLLVLLHGTFSNTSGTFGKLWTQHPEQVLKLFARYDGRVYGFDHPTLGASPIENALTLVGALPAKARVHLLTHSRGGLVAEVLARICAAPKLSPDDRKLFGGAENASQRAALDALAAMVKAKGITVDRVVRVACPARGTLLASKRLDAYLSVFKWTLELAGVAVLPELVEFLGEVAQRRADPDTIPGLAAQIPSSPLVQWLHAAETPIPGTLRVVAGDIEGDSIVSWLKTLLTDAFYWTDHDLVVQTRSMYGGAPRSQGATFVFDQGGAVSHFNYFANQRTATAIVDALVKDQPDGFATIGPLSWAGESSTGTRAARRSVRDAKAASERPAVFMLPGILGSNLKVGDRRIWLGWRVINGLSTLDYTPGKKDGVEPDGPIGMVYDKLAEFLASTHEVREFAFDWRRPMEDEARRLAAAITAELDAREQNGQPVRLLAHSMGGLLARTMQLEEPAVWTRMMERDGARLLMLGTPNAGSWSPMQVLSGDDTFANLLVTFGAPFRDEEARDLMARLPGFLQLQAALTDERFDLDRHETWKQLANDDLEQLRRNSLWHRLKEQLFVYAWGVPPQAVLDRAVTLRRRLDAQRDGGVAGFRDRLLLVVGRADFTPDGYEVGDDGLVYLDAQENGDGRVTLSSAQLPGVRTWTLNCEHGSLPSEESAFPAYLDLLVTGDTKGLTPLAASRGAGLASAATVTHVRSRPSRGRSSGRPAENERAVLARPTRAARPARAPRGGALRVTVVNGDLTFVRHPLLIGHYRSLKLTGTENVMDNLLRGAMSDALTVGHYPVAAGEHAVFVNTNAQPDDPRQMPRPEAVIVAGLGEEGNLSGTDLVRTVRRATIAWSQRASERGDTGVEIELAATLIGSGGIGFPAGKSARFVAQGVREANERLHEANQRLGNRAWPLIGHLHLIELYLDRATDAWSALHVQAQARAREYSLTKAVRTGRGCLPRPIDSGYRGADYSFIRAATVQDENGDAVIEYTLDTKRARSEVRAQKAQGRLVRQLVTTASDEACNDPQIGCTLFNLLIPAEIEPYLMGVSEMQIELDRGTAAIPWELLDTGSSDGDTRPWAIRVKLLRKLRTADFRTQVRDAGADDGILVIGEPKCDPNLYARLPGAREEAKAVAELLRGAVGGLRPLISDENQQCDAQSVLDALFERGRVWRIIHVAGHGAPPERIVDPRDPDGPQRDGDPRGVVLSDGIYLGPREIGAMRDVPELVFVNCCHLAANNPTATLRPDDRARFAAGVAEALIKLGVRCVVAAGWAVGDAQAKWFAATFYGALLRGERFLDAVAEAREAAREAGGNTWAAYQCYGDPDWRFRTETGDAQRPAKPINEEFSGVASPAGLVLALRTLETRARFWSQSPADRQGDRTKIRHLEGRFAADWGGMGAVAEAFGAAYSAAENPDAAIDWYGRALEANDGGASLKAVEQLGNLQVRQAWKKAQSAGALDGPKADRRRAVGKRGKRGRGAARTVRSGTDTYATARRDITQALAHLEQVAQVKESVERYSLCGSAWKRLAMLEALAGNPAAAETAVATMTEWYAKAEKLALDQQDPGLFYPALNRVAGQVMLDGGAPARRKAQFDVPAAVRSTLADKNRDDPDFWSVAAVTELRMYEAVARGDLAAALDAIRTEYDDLHTRVSLGWMWASVLDQAEFVLSKYAGRAPGSERDAASALREYLRVKAR